MGDNRRWPAVAKTCVRWAAFWQQRQNLTPIFPIALGIVLAFTGNLSPGWQRRHTFNPGLTVAFCWSAYSSPSAAPAHSEHTGAATQLLRQLGLMFLVEVSTKANMVASSDLWHQLFLIGTHYAGADVAGGDCCPFLKGMNFLTLMGTVTEPVRRASQRYISDRPMRRQWPAPPFIPWPWCSSLSAFKYYLSG